MSDGCFRSKTGFTIVQNYIARDNRLSIKAKGLYLVIQSYITWPDKEWKKTDFMKMISEGKQAFDTAWKELKENGYMQRTNFERCRPLKGQEKRWDFRIKTISL